MTDLEKAREWADRWAGKGQHIPTEAQAAIDLIKSLPDQWIDAENVQAMIDNYKHARDSNAEGTEGWVINHLMVSNLESLIPTPKLPTLADMTPEERVACKWMQCMIGDDTDDYCLLITVDTPCSRVVFQNGNSTIWNNDLITPLPDLPKLEWPGGVVDCEIVDEPEPVDAPPAEKAALPKPEDVPANEPWLIEVDGKEAVGARYAGDSAWPWAVATLDGLFADEHDDNEITLIHKLVPESLALPEGMRIADHETYGRVVVAPRANTHGEESFYRMNEDISWGASHGYRPTGEFNFLDGDQHV